MGRLTRFSTTLAAVAALSGAWSQPLAAQTHLAISLDVGSLYDGVSFGVHAGIRDPGPVFTGFSLGWRQGWGGGAYTSHAGAYAGVPAYHSEEDLCWELYGDRYWDPYGDAYYDCLEYGPTWAYRAHYARRWTRWYSARHVGWYPRASYVYAPSPWRYAGHYDPWYGYWYGYWDGWRTGWRGYAWYGAWWGSGYRSSSYVYRPTRVVYARGGRAGVAIHRPSVFVRSGPTFKEPARTVATRRAQPRRTAAQPVVQGSPRTPRALPGLTGRGAQPRPSAARPSTRRAAPVAQPRTPVRGGDRATARPRASDRSTTAAPSRPARPSDRVRPGRTDPRRASPALSGRTGARRPDARVTPSTGNRPSVDARPSRRVRPQARPSTGARARPAPRPSSRPSARPAPRPSSRPSARPARPSRSRPSSSRPRPRPRPGGTP